MTRLHQSPGFATLVRDFFCQRLLNQQNVSPNTVAAYRDTFRILLEFMQRHRKASTTASTLDDIDAPTVLAFLDHLETHRGNSVRTRNARLASDPSIRHVCQFTGSNGPSTGSASVGYPTEAIHSPLGWSPHTSRDRSRVGITGSFDLERAAGPCFAPIDVQYRGASLRGDRSSL